MASKYIPCWEMRMRLHKLLSTATAVFMAAACSGGNAARPGDSAISPTAEDKPAIMRAVDGIPGWTRTGDIEDLKERNIHLMISLDGLGRDHDAQRIFPDGSGSFVRVVRTLERVKRSGIPFNISAVVSNLSVEGIPAFVEFLLKYEIRFVFDFYKETPCSAGDPSLRVEPDRIIRSMKDAYAAIERYLPSQSMLDSLLDMTRLGLLHDRPCGVGQNYIAFDPQGRAVKCQMAFDDIVSDSSRPDPLGDIRADFDGVQNPPATEKPGLPLDPFLRRGMPAPRL
jgi:hypothetical protein